MDDLSNFLKAFRDEVMSLNIHQKDLQKFRLRLMKVEVENKKLKEDLTAEKEGRKEDFVKLMEIVQKLQTRCDAVEQRMGKVETITMLDVSSPEIQDLITDFPDYQSPAMPVQGSVYFQNVQQSNSAAMEVPGVPGLGQFIGDPNPPPAVLVTPDNDPLLPDALQFTTLFEQSSTPLFSEEVEEILNDVSPPPEIPSEAGANADEKNVSGDSSTEHEDSDSGIDENPPSPPPLKKAALWKMSHDKDPIDPFGLTCLCGIKKENKKGMTEHIRYYTLKWQFSCKLCNKQFARLNILRKHEQKFHPDQLTSAAKKEIGCRKCGGEFLSRGEHKKHLSHCGQNSCDGGISLGLIESDNLDTPMDVDNPAHGESFEASPGGQSQTTSPPGVISLSSEPIDLEDFSNGNPSTELQEAVQLEIMKLISVTYEYRDDAGIKSSSKVCLVNVGNE